MIDRRFIYYRRKTLVYSDREAYRKKIYEVVVKVIARWLEIISQQGFFLVLRYRRIFFNTNWWVAR